MPCSPRGSLRRRHVPAVPLPGPPASKAHCAFKQCALTCQVLSPRLQNVPDTKDAGSARSPEHHAAVRGCISSVVRLAVQKTAPDNAMRTPTQERVEPARPGTPTHAPLSTPSGSVALLALGAAHPALFRTPGRHASMDVATADRNTPTGASTRGGTWCPCALSSIRINASSTKSKHSHECRTPCGPCSFRHAPHRAELGGAGAGAAAARWQGRAGCSVRG